MDILVNVRVPIIWRKLLQEEWKLNSYNILPLSRDIPHLYHDLYFVLMIQECIRNIDMDDAFILMKHFMVLISSSLFWYIERFDFEINNNIVNDIIINVIMNVPGTAEDVNEFCLYIHERLKKVYQKINVELHNIYRYRFIS